MGWFAVGVLVGIALTIGVRELWEEYLAPRLVNWLENGEWKE